MNLILQYIFDWLPTQSYIYPNSQGTNPLYHHTPYPSSFFSNQYPPTPHPVRLYPTPEPSVQVYPSIIRQNDHIGDHNLSQQPEERPSIESEAPEDPKKKRKRWSIDELYVVVMEVVTVGKNWDKILLNLLKEDNSIHKPYVWKHLKQQKGWTDELKHRHQRHTEEQERIQTVHQNIQTALN